MASSSLGDWTRLLKADAGSLSLSLPAFSLSLLHPQRLPGLPGSEPHSPGATGGIVQEMTLAGPRWSWKCLTFTWTVPGGRPGSPGNGLEVSRAWAGRGRFLAGRGEQKRSAGLAWGGADPVKGRGNAVGPLGGRTLGLGEGRERIGKEDLGARQWELGAGGLEGKGRDGTGMEVEQWAG